MELSVFLELITATAVVLGILFGLLQLRHYHVSRKRESALHLLTSFQTAEFVQGTWLTLGLPDGLSTKEIEDRVGEVHLIHLSMSTWESIGILVFNRETSLSMVHDAYGGLILISWKRLENYVVELRETLQSESLYEWFQWLAERMIDLEKAETQVPAYIGHCSWES